MNLPVFHDPRIGDAIERNTVRAGKTYSFNEGHDRTRPIDRWFQHTEEGVVLFTIFYTQACRFSMCTGCNLPSLSSRNYVDYQALISQIDHVFADPAVAAQCGAIAKLIVSNNGSVLDEQTFPSTALMHLLVQCNLRLPQLKVISFESRPEYVEVDELEFMSRAMAERERPAEIELAIGFEAFDDHIRNKVFLKGLTLRAFESLVERITQPHFRLKCYFMQKPVADMTDDTAVADIQAGIDYLHRVAGDANLTINMHLNPTYVARGTPLADEFAAGRYAPPRLADVARAVLHGRDKQVSIFVGLNDEGLAVPGGTFLRSEDEPLRAALEAFNRTQDYAALASQCGLA
jgi:hypothetical protein